MSQIPVTGKPQAKGARPPDDHARVHEAALEAMVLHETTPTPAGATTQPRDGYAEGDRSAKLRRELSADSKADARFARDRTEAPGAWRDAARKMAAAHADQRDAVPPPRPAPGQLSPLFPEMSLFDAPLANAPVPADADLDEVEEEAHVVSYTTANGERTCELWWMGGDGGTPILAYLVDGDGAHYLPELSQPSAEGESPFGSVEEAAKRFAELAERS